MDEKKWVRIMLLCLVRGKKITKILKIFFDPFFLLISFQGYKICITVLIMCNIGKLYPIPGIFLAPVF